MKFSKTLLGLLAMLVLPAVTALAQAEHRSQSFLNVQAVYLTNLYNPTNLATAGTATTNIVGLTMTNFGARVTCDGTNNARVNPFKDVQLWAMTDGRGAWSEGSTNGTGILYNQSFASISVTWTAGSGANTAIPFVVTPLFNGRNEATSTADEWTFAFTPTASATQTLTTNVPLYRWPGAAKLRLRRAVNTDTDASSQVIVSDISLNGFVP